MVAPTEGPFPYFNDAFTQLYLGQLLAFVKCTGGDQRDGGIDPNADDIARRSLSTRPRVDEDLGTGSHDSQLFSIPSSEPAKAQYLT